MIVNNFKKITIGKKGVILKFKNKEQKEIPFSEIKKICIKAKKTPVLFIWLIVAISLSLVLLSLWLFGLKLVLFSPLFLILIGVIKLNNYKRYVLKIKLKCGNSIIQPIPLKLKYKTIDDITKIRKVIYRLS